MSEIKREVSFEEAKRACVQHYVGRRNPPEHEEMMMSSIPQEMVFEIYEIAKRQTKELLELGLIDENDPAAVK